MAQQLAEEVPYDPYVNVQEAILDTSKKGAGNMSTIDDLNKVVTRLGNHKDNTNWKDEFKSDAIENKFFSKYHAKGAKAEDMAKYDGDKLDGTKTGRYNTVKDLLEQHEEMSDDLAELKAEEGSPRYVEKRKRFLEKHETKIKRDAHKLYRDMDKIEAAHEKAISKLTESKHDTFQKLDKAYQKARKAIDNDTDIPTAENKAAAKETLKENYAHIKEQVKTKYDDLKEAHEEALEEVADVRKHVHEISKVEPPAKGAGNKEAVGEKAASHEHVKVEGKYGGVGRAAEFGAGGILTFMGVSDLMSGDPDKKTGGAVKTVMGSALLAKALGKFRIMGESAAKSASHAHL